MMSFMCETCLYWEAKKSDKGLCRRRGPALIQVHIDRTGSDWPVTRASDWCGEGTMDIEKAREKEGKA